MSRSSRPGRQRALSRAQGRLVAHTTRTSLPWSTVDVEVKELPGFVATLSLSSASTTIVFPGPETSVLVPMPSISLSRAERTLSLTPLEPSSRDPANASKNIYNKILHYIHTQAHSYLSYTCIPTQPPMVICKMEAQLEYTYNRTRCIHIFACLVPICMLNWCLLTK